MIIKPYSGDPENLSTIFLVQKTEDLQDVPINEAEKNFVTEQHAQNEKDTFLFNRLSHYEIIQLLPEKTDHEGLEHLRKRGERIKSHLTRNQQDKCLIRDFTGNSEALSALAEGMALGAYGFSKHKKPAKNPGKLEEIYIDGDTLKVSDINQLNNMVKACYLTRDLVNEPSNQMDAVTFAHLIAEAGKEAGIKATILNKEEIKKHNMTGLLTVNMGSVNEPTFTILEWKPENAVNDQPVVLVGKGLVYDTGGINLKPESALDGMKSDMAGGAAVFGAIYALAQNKAPIHVVGLIPATDNRPGGNAMVPGDIIKMGNGKTVEIINTDAEGRLILADALLYAQQLKPLLVIDIATLTGSATMAIGRFGIIAMHMNAEKHMSHLETSGNSVYERIARLPFWKEYDKEIESDVADIRNLSKNHGAGAITAGKFLSHFIDYPWIHLDIATMAYLDSADSYRGKGGTGAGVRLLYDFLWNLQHRCNQS